MATSTNAAVVATLVAARVDLASVIKAQTAAWVASGCPPTFSLDGESYQWNEWLKSKTDAMDGLTASIQKLSSPWLVRSTGRV